MAQETTIFTFKISVPFEEWAKSFDGPDVMGLHKANAVTTYTEVFVKMVLNL